MSLKTATIGVLSGLAALGVTISATAQHNEQTLQGEVISVRPENQSITVRLNDTGQTRQFTVDDDTEITFEGRFYRMREGALGEIDPGDVVELAVESSPTGERVRRFERNRSAQTAANDGSTRTNTQAQAGSSQADQQDSSNATTQQRRLPATATPLWIQTLMAGLALLGVGALSRLIRSANRGV